MKRNDAPKVPLPKKKGKSSSGNSLRLAWVIGLGLPILLAAVVALKTPTPATGSLANSSAPTTTATKTAETAPSTNPGSTSLKSNRRSKAVNEDDDDAEVINPPLDGTVDARTLYAHAAWLLQKKNKPEEAVPILQYAAVEQKLPHAHQLLAELYYNEIGVEKDYEKAVEHFQAAADLNHGPSYVSLGFMFENGHGCEKDFVKAFEWYKKSAEEADDPVGMVNLAIMHRNARGTTQNFEEMKKWLERAALMKNPRAMLELGNMYFGGMGVKKNYPRALRWYLKSLAEEDSPSANFNVANMIRYGLGTEKNLTEAATYYAKASKQGHPEAEKAMKTLFHDFIADQKALMEANMKLKKEQATTSSAPAESVEGSSSV
eukprot:TRINITY_DN12495_c0_g1_i1.p1 TRINITY_DN12495_c0_g1~~TRINITY_DN12495_c0_g1_i1.p1  ORF type:complete len:388 (-),score=126.50 TRINITY_DN12495_c0_g1_i1:26-1150(-)